ncbi:hypothetical protein, partial [Iningainema tapete]
MGRYSDINRGPELQDAYEKYQLWLKKSRKEKKAAYKTVAKPETDRVKTERTIGYILPFNSENDNVHLETRVIDATQTGQGASTGNIVKGLIDDRFNVAPPTGPTDQVVKVPKYKFAKIIASQRTTTATNESDSRITETPYKRHRSDNVSASFGRKGSSDNYSEALKEIKAKAAYKTFVAATG